MVSSSRQAIACIVLIFGIAFYSHAQTSPAKPSTASISGKVTIKGKGVSGITVVAIPANHRGRGDKARHRGTTDSSGAYRISNLPKGNYQINPYAPAFVVENERASLMVAEGETIEEVNFALVQGGVITGKVTDSEGQPLIEELVHLTQLDNQSQNLRVLSDWVQTDDRGIYRVFGLRAGQYKVSAGRSDHPLSRRSRESYRETFHPSTTDVAKATVIEVFEGSEIKNVDIVMTSRALNGFTVSGRIVDGESGKPLRDIIYGLTQVYEGGSSSISGARSNADGEFRFENVVPGKYYVFIQPPPGSDMGQRAVSFEVTDRDITGLTIKTAKGASLSGIVVLEGPDEKPLTTKRGEAYILAFVESSASHGHHNTPSPALNPDGTFRIVGLRAGTAHISITSMNREPNDFVIVRVERDGVPQPNNTITLKDGEQVDGVRVIVNQFTGAIRGQVKIEGGELPPFSWMSVNAWFQDYNAAERPSRSGQVDSRGRFFIEALKAGRYEVQVSVFVAGPQPKHFQSKQEVTVADNAVSEVVFTVKLKTDGP